MAAAPAHLVGLDRCAQVMCPMMMPGTRMCGTC